MDTSGSVMTGEDLFTESYSIIDLNRMRQV